MTVSIRFCGAEEIGRVKAFLSRHWHAEHILTRHDALLAFQHADAATGGLSFVVASREGEDELMGILGFIPVSRYDSSLSQRDTLWLTTWMVRQDLPPTGLGLALHQFLAQSRPHCALGTVGNNARVEVLYRGLGYETGIMRQHVMLNPSCPSFVIATVPEGLCPPRPDHGVIELIAMDEAALEQGIPGLALKARAGYLPAKTPAYFLARFLRHPIYTYMVYLLRRGSDPVGLIALRRIHHKGSSALRIVDFLGDDAAFAGCGEALMALMASGDDEYVDILEYGLSEECVRQAGFLRVETAGPLVIPNYFEPFEARNVEIRYAFRTDNRPFTLFRADADQDRPNRVPVGQN